MRRREIPRDSGAVVGCYSVTLYCQHPRHMDDYNNIRLEARVNFCGDFTERNERRCLRDARRAGWWISRNDAAGHRAALCPYHAREVPR